MPTIDQIRAEVTERAVTLSAPGQRDVVLSLAVRRVAEANGDDPACRDRVTAEWAREVDVDGAPALREVMFAYTHDSYDGEHRVVLEDGHVSRPMLAAILADLGVTAAPEDLVAYLAPLHGDLGASLLALLDPETSYFIDDEIRAPEHH